MIESGRQRIKDKEELNDLFSSLDKNRSVVVYTNTGVKASMIWLALTLLDYDARIYSGRIGRPICPHLTSLQKAYARPILPR